MNEKTTLFQKSSPHFRPLTFNRFEAEAFVFYGEGQIYLKVDRGWLEHIDTTQYHYRSDVILFTTDEVKRAVRENLKRTDNYYVSGSRQYGNKGYVVYLHIRPEDLGEMKTSEDELTTSYTRFCSIPLSCSTKNALGVVIKRNSIVVVSNYRTEKRAFGVEVDNMAQALKEIDIDMPEDDIAKLLNAYTLTRKGKE